MRIPKSKTLYVCAAIIVLLGGSAATASAAYKTVTVQDNGQRKVIKGFTLGNLGLFLNAKGIQVTKRDRISPNLTASVEDGMNVVIERPVNVELVDGNKSVSHHIVTFAKTVGQFLHERRVMLGSLDTVDQPLHSKLRAGEAVHVIRRQQKVTTRTQEIPFQTIRQRTDSLYVGQQHVLTYGVKGLLKIQTSSVFVNGRKSRQHVSKFVVKKPIVQVIQVGDRVKPKLQPVVQSLSSRGADSLIIRRQLTVVATAYVSGGRTATGQEAQPGVIAVDPSVIPLGTKLYIPGYGVAYARDTGGSIVGNRIDVCVGSYDSARSWGVRTITIYEIQ